MVILCVCFVGVLVLRLFVSYTDDCVLVGYSLYLCGFAGVVCFVGLFGWVVWDLMAVFCVWFWLGMAACPLLLRVLDVLAWWFRFLVSVLILVLMVDFIDCLGFVACGLVLGFGVGCIWVWFCIALT